MNDPDAKDYKWLVARERGEDVGHVLAAERAPYERLGALLGSGKAPRAGFRQRVLDAIDAVERAEKAAAEPEPEPAVVAPEPAVAKPEPAVAELEPAVAEPDPAVADARVVPLSPRPKPKPKRPRWIAGGLAAAAAAAAVLVFFFWRSGPEPDRTIVLVAERRSGKAVVRATSTDPAQATLGDTLVVRAEATGPAEVRVYGGSGERLIAKCSDRGGCTIERTGERRRFLLEVPLRAPGNVRAVVFVGASVPESSGSLEQDLEVAAGARIEYKLQTPPIRVL